jgi:hypothetical protein
LIGTINWLLRLAAAIVRPNRTLNPRCPHFTGADAPIAFARHRAFPVTHPMPTAIVSSSIIAGFLKIPPSGITSPPRCLSIESYFVGGGGENEVAISNRITRHDLCQPWSKPSSDPIVPGAGQ